MSDYAKKTVAELTEILKGRSLPHSGKKADLIARLEENDKAGAPAESDNTFCFLLLACEADEDELMLTRLYHRC